MMCLGKDPCDMIHNVPDQCETRPKRQKAKPGRHTLFFSNIVQMNSTEAMKCLSLSQNWYFGIGIYGKAGKQLYCQSFTIHISLLYAFIIVHSMYIVYV